MTFYLPWFLEKESAVEPTHFQKRYAEVNFGINFPTQFLGWKTFLKKKILGSTQPSYKLVPLPAISKVNNLKKQGCYLHQLPHLYQAIGGRHLGDQPEWLAA